jgi:hypothetical protein
MDTQVILKRFHPKTPEPEEPLEILIASNWRKTRELVQAAFKEGGEKEFKQILYSLHYLQVQNDLLLQENQGLRESLNTKKKHKKQGKTLDLQQRQEYHSGAVLWSPRKMREARVRMTVKEKEEEEEKVQKALRKKERRRRIFRRRLRLNRSV